MNCSGTCTCIALYDLDIAYVQRAEHIKELFYYLEKWFVDNEQLPTRMSLEGKKIPSSTQTRTFKYYKRLLEKVEFQEIDGFWIGSFSDNHSTDSLDGLLTTSLRIKEGRSSFYLYFHNDIIHHSWEYVENILKYILTWIKSGYGISFQRDLNKGPGWYTYGVIVNSDDRNHPLSEYEEDNMTKWFHTYGDPEDYHHGDLRDIYPLNLLSKEHLERSINGKTLQSWIESSSDHGTLKPLTDTLWSWRVPEDKISIVREALRPSGIILCI